MPNVTLKMQIDNILIEVSGEPDYAEKKLDELFKKYTPFNGISEDIEIKKDHGAPLPQAFLKEKKPMSAVEQIVCLGYYLNKYKNIQSFKTAELIKLNTEAGGQNISNPVTAVRDATFRYGYFMPLIRGKKNINNRGEAVVEALPDREKVKQVLVDMPLRKKRIKIRTR